jgi:hypothetical protein
VAAPIVPNELCERFDYEPHRLAGGCGRASNRIRYDAVTG